LQEALEPGRRAGEVAAGGTRCGRLGERLLDARGEIGGRARHRHQRRKAAQLGQIGRHHR
jgi:hypothetical protein